MPDQHTAVPADVQGNIWEMYGEIYGHTNVQTDIWTDVGIMARCMDTETCQITPYKPTQQGKIHPLYLNAGDLSYLKLTSYAHKRDGK